MDPDAALQTFREALSEYHSTSTTEDDEVFLAIAYRAMEAAEALDQWLSKGGFLPHAWEVARDA